MKRLLRIGVFLMAVFAVGCMQVRYRVFMHNGTNARIVDAKVVLGNDESLVFGNLDAGIDAGIWPVSGPLDEQTMVEWSDVQAKKKSAKARLSVGWNDDSIIFIINSNDTVTVQTGRKLYGLRKPD